jgi:hypothetical protein
MSPVMSPILDSKCIQSFRVQFKDEMACKILTCIHQVMTQPTC